MKKIFLKSACIYLFIICAYLLFPCFSLAKQSIDTVLLVEDHNPLSVIIIPVNSTRQIRDAAKLLSHYIQLSTKALIDIQNDSVETDKIKIHIGNTSYVKNLNIYDKKLDKDGFVIAFPDAKNVVICGASDWGTEFAVYEFLERYLGIRWLFPGDLGEYIPEHKTLRILTDEVRQEPAFKTRRLSGLPGREKDKYETWARRIKTRAWRYGIHGSHNIGRVLLPPDKYIKTHPEFFPIIKGKRFFPSEKIGGKYWKIHAWQPCFSEKGTIEESVKNICEYFKKHPEKITCSLGINDAGGHCECSKCLSQIGSKKNVLGMENYSNLYYKWVNKIVEEVLKKYPNKKFGLIAYSEVADPPTGFKLNSHIVPYITYERLKWADHNIQKHRKLCIQKWSKATNEIGWYDYSYGRQYIIPRLWPHLRAEYYRFGYSQNVRHLCAESYPNKDWREGPKRYIDLKLQWNPFLDVDSLLRDWYECAVGIEAAPFLAKYYEFWENFWTGTVHKTSWFNNRGSTYLNFNSTDYVKALSGTDMIKCEQLLRSALSYAKTERQKLRAEFFLNGFKACKKDVLPYLIKGEQIRRLRKLSNLKGNALRFALNNYKKWFKNSPVSALTDSINLKIGLLLEKAEEKGAWHIAFKESPWSKSRFSWYESFCNSIKYNSLSKETFIIKSVSEPPMIDGKLNDASWIEANKITDFKEYAGDIIVSQPTIVSCMYDKNNLYISYVCFEKNINELISNADKRDGKLWCDDCIEFFIDPQGKGNDFYQIIISSPGIRYDAHKTDSLGWNPEYKAKAFVGDTFWSVEMAVPFKIFGIERPEKGKYLKVNFNRERKSSKNRIKEISGWQFTAGNNQTPKLFGKLLFQ